MRYSVSIDKLKSCYHMVVEWVFVVPYIGNILTHNLGATGGVAHNFTYLC